MPRKIKLIDQIWDMAPATMLPFKHGERAAAVVRVTVSRVNKQDKTREYTVKQTRDGVVVIRLS